MAITHARRHLNAPREKVYAALVDAKAIEQWKVPTGMTCEVHVFEPREGGSFRVSLTYDAGDGIGKSGARTDTYHGHFVTLTLNERVVETMEFETDDPMLRGEMTVTTTLTDADGGTDLVAVHEGVPPGVRPEDNELGWRLSLAKLAAFVER